MQPSTIGNDLEARLRQKARKELHENPAEVDAHLASLTRWIQASPHLTIPTEPHLLLPFLRHAKYIHSKAQARLDNFCTLRTSETQGVPQWFEPISMDDPVVENYLKSGIVVPLGRTANDVHMFLVRLRAWDKDAISLPIYRRLNYMDFDRVVLDSCVQIVGYGVFFDMSDSSTRDLMMMQDRKEVKMTMKIWQESYPLRVKHLIYYNEPKIFDAIFKIAEQWMSSKMRGRILRIKNDISKAFKKVPGLKEIMPPEYGGNNLPLARLIEENAKSFRQFYTQPSPWRLFKVDESKRPEWAKNYMRTYNDLDEQITGATGTYIKINPDD